MTQQQIMQTIVSVAAFVLVMAIWLVVTLLWRLGRSKQEQKIHGRLGIASSADSGEAKVLRLWHSGGVAETTVQQNVRLPLLLRLEQMRIDAGWSTPMPRVIFLLVGVLGLVSVLLVALTGNLLLPAVVVVLLAVAFKVFFQFCINRRSELFERQLVDALELGARSLRAGHPLSGAFRLISEEIAEPIGTVFGEICEQEALGVGVQDALESSAARSRNPDMQIFAASVVIQLRSGGNLADMMERVTWVIRERMRLNRRARVLSAEAQLSKWVLMGLPIVLFLGLSVMRPE